MARSGFSFIDLFAGIGGIRMAFEKAGGRCVFSSEWNKYSQQTYEANFGEIPEGDITKIAAKDIPNHDILAAGFPCQPFSIAGVSARNSLNRPHGFEDEIQGTLFFDIVRILKEKRPKAFLLENVKNLRSHDKGHTFKVIMKALQESLGYDVHVKVIDARALVPQHRERIYIVGFAEPMSFEFPEFKDRKPRLGDILDTDPSVSEYGLPDGTWRVSSETCGKAQEAWKRIQLLSCKSRRRIQNHECEILQGWRRDTHTAGRWEKPKDADTSRMLATDGFPKKLQNSCIRQPSIQAVRKLRSRTCC